MKWKIRPLVSFLLVIPSLLLAEEAKPKYGPEAVPLSKRNEYLRKRPAPDYWALAPYYAAQFNEKACSVASVAMVLNAARRGWRLSSDEPLITQTTLLEKVKSPRWDEAILSKKTVRTLSMDEVGDLLKKSLQSYGLKGSVELFHTDDTLLKTEKRLHEVLVQNEKSGNDFLIINFIQGIYTDDADVGHIAPIGAYDAKRRQVLVMDPDREWYEPYWVSEGTLLKGMATIDRDWDRNRGYIWVKITN